MIPSDDDTAETLRNFDALVYNLDNKRSNSNRRSATKTTVLSRESVTSMALLVLQLPTMTVGLTRVCEIAAVLPLHVHFPPVQVLSGSRRLLAAIQHHRRHRPNSQPSQVCLPSISVSSCRYSRCSRCGSNQTRTRNSLPRRVRACAYNRDTPSPFGNICACNAIAPSLEIPWRTDYYRSLIS